MFPSLQAIGNPQLLVLKLHNPIDHLSSLCSKHREKLTVPSVPQNTST